MNAFFKTIMIIGMLLLSLTGCQRRDVKYLLDHPQKFHSILADCGSMGFPAMQSQPQCLYAYSLLNMLIKYTGAEKLAPQQFGNRVLSAQMDRDQLAQRIQQAKNAMKSNPNNEATRQELTALTRQYDQLNQKIKVMVRLVAISEGM